MNISPQNNTAKKRGFWNWLSRKKYFVFIAVILLTFFILQKLELPVTADNETAQEELIEEQGVIQDNGLFASALNLNAAISIPAAQASVDFSADDELENSDFAIMQSLALVAPSGPGESNPFSGMRKDVITYTVMDGDTPFDLAIKFGINTDTILWANNLREGDLIRPGQKLTILPINGIQIKTGSKDTVDSLAKKYNGKTDEIIAFNNLSTDGKFNAGIMLIIPNGEMPSAAPSKPSYSSPKYANLPSAGWLILPTTGRDWGKVHGQNGVDVANVCGTPIYAAAAGTVILSDGVGWNYGYGKYIEIKHANGVITLYGHASQLLVDNGEEVAQGQLIAYMGTTGRSTGCHLHFEVRGAKNPLAGAKVIK